VKTRGGGHGQPSREGKKRKRGKRDNGDVAEVGENFYVKTTKHDAFARKSLPNLGKIKKIVDSSQENISN